MTPPTATTDTAPTLRAVLSAVTPVVRQTVEAQAGVLAWDNPIPATLDRLSTHALALLIRDLEDFPNARREVPEQILTQTIRTVWEAGRARLGRRFDDMVSEYE